MRIDCKQAKTLTDMKTYWWTQKQRKKYKTKSLVSAGPPDRVSVLFTKSGGCHPKGFIVASLHKIKQIIIMILKFIRQSQFFVLLDKN